MGKEKAGFLTPKAIGNRIKSKGLQKLRWYCQMCQKQCRDENGFKCHCMSESHQRQLLLFADNAQEYLDGFSKEFMETFIELLKRRFGTRRVHCNIVYNEFISESDHLHMNSTMWATLTEFIMYLGKEGMVVVDPTEKGIFITWIDRDPETLRRQQILLKREKFEALEAEKAERQMDDQIARGQQQSKPVPEAVFTELKRDEESGEKIAFSLSSAVSSSAASSSATTTGGGGASEEDCGERGAEAAGAPAMVGPAPTAAQAAAAAGTGAAATATATSSSGKPLLAMKTNPLEEAARKAKLAKQASGGGDSSRKRKSALEEIMEEEERRKRFKRPTGPGAATSKSKPAAAAAKAPSSSSSSQDSSDAWLLSGIVVKVVDKHHGLHRAKCPVVNVADRGRTAQVRAPDGELALVPAADLETVIPAIGRSVLVLRGEHRGMEAILEKINVKDFCVSVTVVRNMKQLKRVPYEHVSKMAAKN